MTDLNLTKLREIADCLDDHLHDCDDAAVVRWLFSRADQIRNAT